jgi:hypothetical protein
MEAHMRTGSFAIAFFFSVSCSGENGSGSSPDQIGTEDAGPGDMCYPLGEPTDPVTLPPCCDGRGAAHCVPGGVVPSEYQEALASCEGGAFCVPDELIESGGTFQPRTCSAGDLGPGVCLSVCIKKVSDNAGFLQRDVCAPTELCAPCMVGTDPTGACEIGGGCE